MNYFVCLIYLITERVVVRVGQHSMQMHSLFVIIRNDTRRHTACSFGSWLMADVGLF
jgi:hypothetical protein